MDLCSRLQIWPKRCISIYVQVLKTLRVDLKRLSKTKVEVLVAGGFQGKKRLDRATVIMINVIQWLQWLRQSFLLSKIFLFHFVVCLFAFCFRPHVSSLCDDWTPAWCEHSQGPRALLTRRNLTFELLLLLVLGAYFHALVACGE